MGSPTKRIPPPDPPRFVSIVVCLFLNLGLLIGGLFFRGGKISQGSFCIMSVLDLGNHGSTPSCPPGPASLTLYFRFYPWTAPSRTASALAHPNSAPGFSKSSPDVSPWGGFFFLAVLQTIPAGAPSRVLVAQVRWTSMTHPEGICRLLFDFFNCWQMPGSFHFVEDRSPPF